MWVEDALTEERWLTTDSFDGAGWMIRRFWLETECPSVRKSQLFACACARLVWPLLSDERCRRGVETAERYLDGIASQYEMEKATDDAFQAHRSAERDSPAYWAAV